ncbi:AGC/PKA protein kinase [Allomyces macrogynus ATCC 38327]|uniref:cAMP-dependent protein kinase n=1 Tax=Allomyces macrogynus (strain ATCC 38327) TaxID=578462 RepID=A0A0L0RVH7_ALLM3|nr:AGC/PKA protein kinase [Allomyces macrogynus ATCC 38327]|eukprot:KNE54134.1 AGC/PKA protein kinase [Allomyces macrogynus ATCC 38327]
MLAAPSAAAPSLAAAAAAAKPSRTPTLALHRTLLHASSSAPSSAAPAPSSRQPVPPSPRPPAKRPHGARPTRRASKRTSPNGGSISSGSSSNGSTGSKQASGATQSGASARPPATAAKQGTSTTRTVSTSGPTSTTTMAPRAGAAAINAATPARTAVVRAPTTDDARAGMPHATAWAPIPPSPAEAVTTATTAMASSTTKTSSTTTTATAPTHDHVTLPAHALPTPAASYAVPVAPKQQQEPAAPASKTCSTSMTTSFLMASPPQSPVLAAAPHAPAHDGAAPAKDDAIPTLALTHEAPPAPKLAAASIPTPPAVEHAHPLLWTPSTPSSSLPPKPTRALSTASDASSDLASTARIAPAATLAKLSATPAPAPAPRRLHLGDFQLLETLGTGTFGRVHLARHRSATNQYYAMKVLAKTDVVRLKQVAHINSERAILARVHHPFLVNMVATFHDARNLYMLLEYVSGGELFTYLRRVGRLHPNAARFYAAEIVTAIEHLHAREITYRDLKPENLLIDAQGHIKITDFGFAKVVPDRTWTLCGTPEYLAPEIIKGTGHGKAVDWWSLGILIFELLCGYPPFYDDSPYGIYEKILAGRLQFPAFVDAAARDLIRNLLAHDWTKRLGALKGGASDIKNHRWFANINWDELVARRVTPPMIPRVHGPGDTNNFEKYPEPDPTMLAPCWTAPDHYGHLFPDF